MNQMEKLRNILDEKGIEWTDHSGLDSTPMIRTRFNIKGVIWSVIYGPGSYGYGEGRLELWAPDGQHGDPFGYLDAEEILPLIEGEVWN